LLCQIKLPKKNQLGTCQVAEKLLLKIGVSSKLIFKFFYPLLENDSLEPGVSTTMMSVCTNKKLIGNDTFRTRYY